jgi:hypothetical protein
VVERGVACFHLIVRTTRSALALLPDIPDTPPEERL